MYLLPTMTYMSTLVTSYYIIFMCSFLIGCLLSYILAAKHAVFTVFTYCELLDYYLLKLKGKPICIATRATPGCIATRATPGCIATRVEAEAWPTISLYVLSWKQQWNLGIKWHIGTSHFVPTVEKLFILRDLKSKKINKEFRIILYKLYL